MVSKDVVVIYDYPIFRFVFYFAGSKSFRTHLVLVKCLIHKSTLRTQMISRVRFRLMTDFKPVFLDIDITSDMLDVERELQKDWFEAGDEHCIEGRPRRAGA